ncbi:type II toxin-antitoxin system RelE family toxin [Roseobacter sp. HKCCA2468]|uniref:type II toxin-antitoxin system RelE family toxin n=1 Tax=Roseobacter sp. HKCCA2468 TaxID=3120342 RepID=UPI0030EED535
MTYSLEFHVAALREWKKLGVTSRAQFKAKLGERLIAPHVPADRLSGGKNRYKIKLRSSGYRLVYSVDDTTVTVGVIAVGKRERGAVYRSADARE